MALIFNEPDVTWMHLPFYIKLMSATEYPRLVDSTSADIGAFNHITTGSITFRRRDILVLDDSVRPFRRRGMLLH